MRTGDGGRPRDPFRTRMLAGAVVAVMAVMAVPGMADGGDEDAAHAALPSRGLVAAVAAAEEAAAGPAACRGGEPGACCRHCTVQKDTPPRLVHPAFCGSEKQRVSSVMDLFSAFEAVCEVCSSPRARLSSSLGEAPPETPPTPPGGQTVCHLSARVDTMGGLVGLLSRMRSRSVMVVALSLGTSCRLWMLS